jgi:hypothetical protein
MFYPAKKGYDMELKFEDEAGNPLQCDGVLDLLAWPGSLTLNVELNPSSHHDQASGRRGSASDPITWTNAELSVRLTSKSGKWHTEKRFAGSWESGQRRRVTLNCNVPGARAPNQRTSIQVTTLGLLRGG